MDHAHHPEDVVMGAILGILAALHAHLNPLPLTPGKGGGAMGVEVPIHNQEEKAEHQL